MKSLAEIDDEILRQDDWMMHCGGTLDGYIKRYAGAYENGQEQAIRIYRADATALYDLITQRRSILERELKRQDRLETSYLNPLEASR